MHNKLNKKNRLQLEQLNTKVLFGEHQNLFQLLLVSRNFKFFAQLLMTWFQLIIWKKKFVESKIMFNLWTLLLLTKFKEIKKKFCPKLNLYFSFIFFKKFQQLRTKTATPKGLMPKGMPIEMVLSIKTSLNRPVSLWQNFQNEKAKLKKTSSHLFSFSLHCKIVFLPP